MRTKRTDKGWFVAVPDGDGKPEFGSTHDVASWVRVPDVDAGLELSEASQRIVEFARSLGVAVEEGK